MRRRARRLRIVPPTYGSIEIAVERCWCIALLTGHNVLIIGR